MPSRAAQYARAEERRTKLGIVKVRAQCKDCPPEITWPAEALDFDHLPGHEKLFDLSHAQTRSWSSIQAEMEKCEVVCAGHHRIRTNQRRSVAA